MHTYRTGRRSSNSTAALGFEALEVRLHLHAHAVAPIAHWDFEGQIINQARPDLVAVYCCATPEFQDSSKTSLGKSLALEGADGWIDISGLAEHLQSDFSQLPSFSFAAWLRPNHHNKDQTVLNVKRANGEDALTIFVSPLGQLKMNSGTKLISAIEFTGSISDGQLHHVAYVGDALAMEGRLFVDGVLVATHETYWLPSAEDTWSVGFRPGSEGWGLQGQIDEVLVYDVALDSDQIRALHAHPLDTLKQSEHQALLDLVPHTDAAFTATRSGFWSDVATWDVGTIPGNSATVVIPNGIEVIYDSWSDTPLFWIRVDGHLKFVTDLPSRVTVDTLVVSTSGKLTIGSAVEPVTADATAEIMISGSGVIDLDWDPTQLSRGLISHGVVEIHGAQKTTFVPVATTPTPGSNSVELNSIPSNWRIGDRIVLTGTHLVSRSSSQDEEFVIEQFVGKSVVLDRPIVFSHDTSRSDFKAYVANFTRNVRIATADHEHVPIDQRGHTMFMHNSNVNIKYAEFFELGRTDKSRLLDDFQLDADGHRVLDHHGNPIPGPSTNIRGRYSLHLHRTGVTGSQMATIIGNAVVGSPGWGFVQHDSAAVLTDNAAYNAFGAGFVAEIGNETGVWSNNISIRSLGDATRGEKDGKNNHDIAATGSGFWLQGRLIEVRSNVSVGNGDGAFTYFIRGVDQAAVATQNMPEPQNGRYLDTASPDIPPIRHFENNIAIASLKGFVLIKGAKEQFHDVRSKIENFTAWEVFVGIELQYTSKYTFLDLDLSAAQQFSGIPNELSVGIYFNQNVEDMTVNRATVKGFDVGAHYRKLNVHGNPPVDWQYVLIDTTFVENGENIRNFDASTDLILSAAELTPGRLSLVVGATSDLRFSPGIADRFVVVRGVKADSIGISEYLPRDSAFLDWQSLRNRLKEGYYEYPDGRKAILIDFAIGDRATGDYALKQVPVTLVSDWPAEYQHLIDEAPVLGDIPYSPVDYNYNGVADPQDIDILLEAALGGSYDERYDLNHNGILDVDNGPPDHVDSDFDVLIRNYLRTDYGDANLDGTIDFLDVSALAGGYGTRNGWSAGNFDSVGIVNYLDASFLSGNWGYGMSQSTSVPAGALALQKIFIALTTATDSHASAQAMNGVLGFEVAGHSHESDIVFHLLSERDARSALEAERIDPVEFDLLDADASDTDQTVTTEVDLSLCDFPWHLD